MTNIEREKFLFRLREHQALRKPGVRKFYDRLVARKYLPWGGEPPETVLSGLTDPEQVDIMTDYLITGSIPPK